LDEIYILVVSFEHNTVPNNLINSTYEVLNKCWNFDSFM